MPHLPTIQHHLDTIGQPGTLHNLFCHVLNWRVLTGNDQPLPACGANNEDLTAHPVAQPGGIPVFRIDWPAAHLPTTTRRRQISRLLLPKARQHLLCYLTQDGQQLSIVWAHERSGQQLELRTLTYETGTPARTTLERLAILGFPREEMETTGEIARATVIERINQAFDVDALKHQFFTRYRTCFEAVEQGISGLQDRDARRLFCQQLFNRLLFVAFLERKGWLTFDGRKDYLRTLWQAHQQEQRSNPQANFYQHRLKPLFFAALNSADNTTREASSQQTAQAARIGQVPYLNGDLFAEDENDNNPAIVVPDAVLAEVITDLCSTFNFTLSESTPFDIEVAVDPAMLGKVFEELVTGRHESGSYYTPRAVVAFMCREALKGYLATRLPDEPAETIACFVDEHRADTLHNPSATLEALRSIRVCDPACGSGAYLLGMLHELVTLRLALCTTFHLDALIPPCSSDDGLNAETQRRRDTEMQRCKESTLWSSVVTCGHLWFNSLSESGMTMYERKLEIIQTNLYGVDLDPFAVHIARLRLWLALMVEYEGDAPPPLPNLNDRLKVGDSLTAPIYADVAVFSPGNTRIPNPSPRRSTLLEKSGQGLAQRRKDAKVRAGDGFSQPSRGKEGFSERPFSPREDSVGKGEIGNGETWEREHLSNAGEPPALPGFLTETGDFDITLPQAQGFDWQVAFAEVFAAGGFDVVITNPPYVRHEAIGSTKSLLRKRYADSVEGKSDLYVFFYVRAVQILRPGGMHVFVCSNSWLDVSYGGKLQKYLLEHTHIHAIYESVVEQQFATADVNTIISVIQKGKASDEATTRFVRYHVPCEQITHAPQQQQVLTRTQRELWQDGQKQPGVYTGHKWGSIYLRAPDIYGTILQKMSQLLLPLDNMLSLRYGIKPGAVKFFFLPREKARHNGIEAEFLCPIITTSQSLRSMYVHADKLLFSCQRSKQELQGTRALDYIHHGEAQNIHLGSSVKKNRPFWYSLNAQPFHFLFFRFWDKRFWTPLAQDSLCCSDNFLYGIAQKHEPLALAGLLNNTFHSLQLEIMGRTSQGQGVLNTYGTEYSHMRVINPAAIDKASLTTAFLAVANRPVLPIFEEIQQADRRALDAIVFDAMELTQGERDGVYEALLQKVTFRLQRAQRSRKR
jgi:hypothetical protein